MCLDFLVKLPNLPIATASELSSYILTEFLNVVLKASYERLITNNISVVASDNAMYSANVEFLVTFFCFCAFQ